MAKNLRQSDQIVAGVFEEAVGHRMPEQVGMQLHTDQSRILAAQVPHTTIRERTALANENQVALNWWPSLQVSRQSPASRERQWDASLLPTLAKAKDDCAASFAEHQIAEFQGDQITDPTAGEQKQVEDGVGSDVASQLDLSKQASEPVSVRVPSERVADGEVL